MRRHSPVTLAALALGLTALISGAACKKAEEPVATAAPTVGIPTAVPVAAVTVTDLSLGKSIGADKKVQTPTDTFAPKDTIFASVRRTGRLRRVIHAVDFRTVRRSRTPATVAVAGPAVTRSASEAGRLAEGHQVGSELDGVGGSDEQATPSGRR